MEIMEVILIGVLILVGIAIGIFLICFCFCNNATKHMPKIERNLDVESQRLNTDSETEEKEVPQIFLETPEKFVVLVGDIAAAEDTYLCYMYVNPLLTTCRPYHLLSQIRNCDKS